MEIELSNLFELSQSSVWGLIIIIVLSIGATVASLFSMKRTGWLWKEVAIGSIELILLVCALYIYVFSRWWLALGPLIPFIIILSFYIFTRNSRV